MKYGYFDDKNREYVIERPDTPSPWVNYLGDPGYGQSSQIMPEATVLQNPGQMDVFFAMFLIILISLVVTFTFAIMTLRITGLLPGNQLGKI